jgi:hypothetical protein
MSTTTIFRNADSGGGPDADGPARLADGGCPGPGGETCAEEPSQSKDALQKFIFNEHIAAALELFGFPHSVAVAAKQLNIELIRPNVAVRRSDFVLEMPDGSILVIEFQSSADVNDVIRFLDYASSAAVKYSKFSKELNGFAPVSVMVIYTADVDEKVLKLSFPFEPSNIQDAPGEREDSQGGPGGKVNSGSLHFAVTPVFLGQHIDAAKLLNEPALLDEEWDPNTGLDLELGGRAVHLTLNALLGMLYFVPLALDRGPHLELGAKYFAVGSSISKKTGNAKIFQTMIISALSRKFASKNDIDSHLKELADMDATIAETADLFNRRPIFFFQEAVRFPGRGDQVQGRRDQVQGRGAQVQGRGAQAVRELCNQSCPALGSRQEEPSGDKRNFGTPHKGDLQNPVECRLELSGSPLSRRERPGQRPGAARPSRAFIPLRTAFNAPDGSETGTPLRSL